MTRSPDTDVVVVGSGLAGATCATALVAAGLDVVVLERRDEVGGRVATDVVDGFVCDVGFQLLNPSYPAVRRHLGPAALQQLDLRSFEAAVHVVGDHDVTLRLPWSGPAGPLALVPAVRSGLVRPVEAIRLAAWAAPSLGRVDRLLRRPDAALRDALDRAGVRGPLRAEVLEPFLTGTLATEPGGTSERFVRLLVRSFLLAAPGVPAAGMAAFARRVAAPVRDRVRTGVTVTAVEHGSGTVTARTDGDDWSARAVVVATDAVAARDLVGVDTPLVHGLASWWLAVDEPPSTERLLRVDGRGRRGGPVVNAAVMTNVAPSYAPPGRHLVQATTLLTGDPPREADVRRHLEEMYAVPVSGWQVVVRHAVPHALPGMPPPLDTRRPAALGGGLFVAGDHRDTASIQGAMASGRRVATAVRRSLGAG